MDPIVQPVNNVSDGVRRVFEVAYAVFVDAEDVRRLVCGDEATTASDTTAESLRGISPSGAILTDLASVYALLGAALHHLNRAIQAIRMRNVNPDAPYYGAVMPWPPTAEKRKTCC